MKTFDVFLRNKLASAVIYIRELTVKHDLGVRSKFILTSSNIALFLFREILPSANRLALKTKNAAALETSFAKPAPSKAVLKISAAFMDAASLSLQRLKTVLKTSGVSLLATVFAGEFRRRLSLKSLALNVFKQGILRIDENMVLRSSLTFTETVDLGSFISRFALSSAASAALRYFISSSGGNRFTLINTGIQLYNAVSINFTAKTVLRNSIAGADLWRSIHPESRLVLKSASVETSAVKYLDASHIFILKAEEPAVTLIKFVAPDNSGITLSAAASVSMRIYRKLGDMDGDGLGTYGNMPLFEVDYIEI